MAILAQGSGAANWRPTKHNISAAQVSYHFSYSTEEKQIGRLFQYVSGDLKGKTKVHTSASTNLKQTVPKKHGKMWEFFLSRGLSELIDMAHDRAESDKIKKKATRATKGTRQPRESMYSIYINHHNHHPDPPTPNPNQNNIRDVSNQSNQGNQGNQGNKDKEFDLSNQGNQGNQSNQKEVETI